MTDIDNDKNTGQEAQKTDKTIEGAEKMVDTLIGNFAETEIGKKIPRDIKKLDTQDLIILTMIAKFVLNIPVLILTYEKRVWDQMLLSSISYLIYVVIAIDIAVSLITSLKIKELPFLVSLAASAMKLMTYLLLIIILSIENRSIIFFLLVMSFFFLFASIEALYNFYVHIRVDKKENNAEENKEEYAILDQI